MIVIAELDLTECNTRTDVPDEAMRVLIYSGGDYDMPAALEAMGRCRLMLEGHAYKTIIYHSVGPHFISSFHSGYVLDETTGEVVRG